MQFRLNSLPKNERPRERLHELGANYLSLQELLAVIIAKGSSACSVQDISKELLCNYTTLESLCCASLKDLCRIRGIGYAKAAQIKASFELGKRYYAEQYQPKSDSIITSEHAYRVAYGFLKHEKKENLLLFCLDVHNRLIGMPHILSVGILDCSLVHPREIFNCAIKNYSSKILLAHNHPSGSPEPSVPDVQVTRQVYEASMVMAIPLVDHIVIGHNNYVSIRESQPNLFHS